MAVKIKLKRLGKMRTPQYRIIVADARTKRDGRAIEEIGRYHPKEEPSLIEVNSERAQYWLGVGAQPTEPVAAILRVTGDWQKFRGEAGAEGTLKVAEPKVSKKAVFEAAAKESGEEAKPATTPRKKAAKAEPVAEAASQAAADEATTEAPAEATAEAPAAETGSTEAAEAAGTEAPAAEVAEQPAEAAAEAETPADPAATDVAEEPAEPAEADA